MLTQPRTPPARHQRHRPKARYMLSEKSHVGDDLLMQHSCCKGPLSHAHSRAASLDAWHLPSLEAACCHPKCYCKSFSRNAQPCQKPQSRSLACQRLRCQYLAASAHTHRCIFAFFLFAFNSTEVAPETLERPPRPAPRPKPRPRRTEGFKREASKGLFT